MAKCLRCGISLGLLSFAKMCDRCQAHVDSERLAYEAAQEESQRSARAEFAIEQAAYLRASVARGERVILYDHIYLAVNSRIVDEMMAQSFNISSLLTLGFDGWDVVAVIPRTIGIALTNSSFGSTSGDTWGAGVGGNVVGVYIIIKKEVSTQSNVSDEFLDEYVRRNLNNLLST